MNLATLEYLAGCQMPLRVGPDAETLDAVRLLRAAGLLCAFLPSPCQKPDQLGHGMVLAITPRGRRALEGHLDEPVGSLGHA
jgi:hypothetical protein